MTANHLNRTIALSAMLCAADNAGISPAELTAPVYRRFRTQREGSARGPTDIAIAMLFGGWRRACDHAADVGRLPEEVEEQVRDSLYGDRTQVDRCAAPHGPVE
ncbi:MAG TPA: hypothetical protein VLK58_23680 [Conexibacter sp.]|nr:hypothetical protein [Conexibacter sp.]